MKRIIVVSVFLSIFLSGFAKQRACVVVKNTSTIVRDKEIVEIDAALLKSLLPSLQGNTAYLVKDKKGRVLPSQLTYDKKLLFQASLAAGRKAEFFITVDSVRTYAPLVFGRLYPERSEDFAWENDCVGFRLYGNALRYLDGPSNGMDLWLKRTTQLVLDKWYENALVHKISFHVDHGEGCDPYGVGHSLGAGAMAPFVNGELILNNNFVKEEVLENGPLRFTAKLTYPDIDIAGKKFAESRIVVLDANSHLTKIIQQYAVNEPMPVAAGIVKRTGQDSILVNKEKDYFIYQEPETKDNGQLFLGVLMPQGLDSVFVHSYAYMHPVQKKELLFSHVLGLTTYKPHVPLVYYTGYGWNKNKFPDVKAFDAYMKAFSLKIDSPMEVYIK